MQRFGWVLALTAFAITACQPAARPVQTAFEPLVMPPVPTVQLAPTHGTATVAEPVVGGTVVVPAGGGGGSQTQPGCATTAADGLVAGSGQAPDGRDPVATLGGGDLGGGGGAGGGVRGDDGSQVTPAASPTPR